MDEKTYLNLLTKQREMMTPAIQDAIKKQGELHIICEAKQNRFYELEDRYRAIFSKGVELLFEQNPELHNELPNKETKAEQILAIAEEVKNPNSNSKKISKQFTVVK